MERAAPARARVSDEGGVRPQRGPPDRARVPGPAAVGARLWSRRRAADLQGLAPREHDILALLMADRTCREVAAALELSDHTVRHHVERLKLRFGKATLHGLLGLLVERHLLD